MSNEYLLTWKAERGYYKCDPEFQWLSDEECDWWEEQRIEHFEKNVWRTYGPRVDYIRIPGETPRYRSEQSILREFGLLPPVTSTGKADKEVVREKVNMVDLYSYLFPEIQPSRRTGSRYVQVRCGLHNEKNASMSLDTQLKRYNCFACGEKGDCFQLYMKVNNCSFPEAVDALDRMS